MMLHLLIALESFRRTRTIPENLATFGTNPTQIQALRDSQNNHLALRAGQSHVERIFTESGSYENISSHSKII